jgi:hypothetical protein
MSSLYITEIQHKTRPKSADNNDLNKSVSKFKRTIIPPRKSEMFNRTKKDFLDFLIQEETRFADLEKIETFYQNISINNFKKYNDNEKEVEKKKLELIKLQELIEQEIVNNLNLKKEDILGYYEKNVQSIKSKITKKEHDIECYLHSKERLYKANYLMKKRLAVELKFEESNEKQYNQYIIIKNNAYLSVSKQQNLLEDMRAYNVMSVVKHDVEIENKKKKFNELEFQVFTIKSDTVEVQKKLEDIKNNILNIINLIRRTQTKNAKVNEEKKFLLREFLKTNIKLLHIYRSLEVTDLDDIIQKFNKQRFEYQKLYSQFQDLNKVIALLNQSETDYKNELNQIIKMIQNKTENDAEDDEIVLQCSIRISELKEINIVMKENIQNTEKVLINLTKYLYNYDGKLRDLIKNINILASDEDNNLIIHNYESKSVLGGTMHGGRKSLDCDRGSSLSKLSKEGDISISKIKHWKTDDSKLFLTISNLALENIQ